MFRNNRYYWLVKTIPDEKFKVWSHDRQDFVMSGDVSSWESEQRLKDYLKRYNYVTIGTYIRTPKGNLKPVRL